MYLPLNTSRLTLRCNIPRWLYSPLKVFWYLGQQRNVISAYALNTGLKRIKTHNKTCLLVDVQDISDPSAASGRESYLRHAGYLFIPFTQGNCKSLLQRGGGAHLAHFHAQFDHGARDGGRQAGDHGFATHQPSCLADLQ